MSTEGSTVFENMGIADALKRYRLKVPPYQRDYAWKEDEVSRLLEDISLAIYNQEPQHFVGCVVTIERAKGLLEVVDGQQRLATTAIILAAMRSIVGNTESNGIKVNLVKLIESFLFSIDGSLEESPNLSLNTADDAVFHSLVTRGIPGDGYVQNRPSHRLLKQAFDLATAHLKKAISMLPENDKWVVFTDWIAYLRYKTSIILLMASSDVNAFRMFETLNARGLQVSQAYLIKSYIFGQSGTKIDQAQTLWAGMRTALEAIDNEDIIIIYLRHVWIVTNGFIQQKNLYDNLQKQTRGEKASAELLATWENLAATYVALSNPESPVWDKLTHNPHSLRRHIQVLNLFDIQPLKPLLMAAARKMDKKEVPEVFQRAVSIGIRLIIASRTTTQSVEEPLSNVAKQIWEGKIKTASEMVAFLAPSLPTDQQFRDAFEVAAVSKAAFARYYLRSLELAHKGEPEPWLVPNDDPETITLEHVLPQKPMGNWPAFTDEDVKTYVKRIGNMALLHGSANWEQKSIGFAAKKDHFKCPYLTTSMIAEVPDWTPEEVVERQKKLAALAIKAWPLKGMNKPAKVKDGNQAAAKQVPGITKTSKPRGEDLLGNPELKAAFKKAKRKD